MKSISLALALGLAATLPASAQNDNEAKYNAKLEESFVSNIDWVMSLEEAQLQAKEKQMLIFGYFSRSYAP